MKMRLALLALAATMIPACGAGGNGSGGSPAGGPDPVLFSDHFSGGLGNWTVMSPSVIIDSPVGNPSPSLWVSSGGKAGAAAARTSATFNANVESGLWIWVDVLPGDSNGSINIVNSASPGTLNTYASITRSGALLSIAGQTKTVTFSEDSVFHRWLFLASDGNGSWWRDDVLLFAFPYGGPMVAIELMDLPYGVGTNFDNVTITN
jgi:hypothetical protein